MLTGIRRAFMLHGAGNPCVCTGYLHWSPKSPPSRQNKQPPGGAGLHGGAIALLCCPLKLSWGCDQEEESERQRRDCKMPVHCPTDRQLTPCSCIANESSSRAACASRVHSGSGRSSCESATNSGLPTDALQQKQQIKNSSLKSRAICNAGCSLLAAVCLRSYR